MELAPDGRPKFDLIFAEGATSQISMWNREFGKNQTIKWLYLLIEDLNNYFNVVRPMTSAQILDLSVELSDRLWWVRMEEIVAFLEGVKKQNYGKIYDRLDPAFVWECWDKYEKERNNFLEEKQRRLIDSSSREKENDRADKLTAGVTKTLGAIWDAKEKIKGLRNEYPNKK